MLRCAALLLAVVFHTAHARAGEADAPEPPADREAETAASELGWRALGPAGPFGGEAPPGRTHGLSLGVRAGMARSAGERQRVFGVVELGIGLDDLLGAPPERADEPAPWEPESEEAGAEREPGAPPWPSGRAPGPPQPGERVAPPGSERAAGLASSAVPGAIAAPAAAPARRERPLTHERSGVGAARLARALVAEALRVSGSAAELRRLDAMASRSRAAASLPEVRLGAGTASDESQRLSPTVNDPARFTRDGGRDVWLEARLTWRLDSAIFARDEIAIMRLRAQRQEESGRLAREVLEALVEWRKADLVQRSPFALPEERDAASIRQFGAVARLDVLTEGWFSRYLERWAPSAGAAGWP
jgi:hypothetical protein